MVSVLLLSWNHEKYIEQSIRSVIDQTYKNIEIIFLDNNSSDNTFSRALDLLKSCGLKYEAYKTDAHYGIARNMNFLFSKSHGDYVCLTSGDDWLHKRNIEEKILAFNKMPSAGMVYSTGYKYYDEIDVYERIEPVMVKREDTVAELLQQNFISGIGCVIKKEVIESVGGWSESLMIDDGDLWIKIALKYEIVLINKPLFFYRQHIAAISKDPEFMYKGKMEWFNKYRYLNNHQQASLKNIKETYLAAKVMSRPSLITTWQVLKSFKPGKLYTKLLIKSLLPASWKKNFYIRSLKKRNPGKPEL